MTAYTDAICAALEGLLRSRTEWDEAPDLHFMYREDGRMRLSDDEALVPGMVWGDDVPPPYRLDAMSRSLSMLPPGVLAALVPRTLIAVVFRCETWGVLSPVADRAARKYAEALHAERRLSEHPDRVESRLAWAVTREHSHWTATLDRLTGTTASGPAESPGGLIPESLARIISEITAEVN